MIARIALGQVDVCRTSVPWVCNTPFGSAVVVTARPTGMPSWTRTTQVATPEDIMVCVGGPVTDPAVST
ncbi:hypothetical protein H7H51_31500, partial [Mycolicibacterium farcinogenes]|nr:hypothetical protein [Mycolicibacterium farcinogenes]